MISLPTDRGKSPNLPPLENGPIHTECRILKHVVASAAKAELGGMLHNGQTVLLLPITLHKLGFNQLPNPIKTYNSLAEGIATVTVRQKSTRQRTYDFIGCRIG